MDYKLLVEVINNKYNKIVSSDKWDKIYFYTIEQKQIWNNLENLNEKDTEIMLKFLNVWKCRIDKKILPELCKALIRTHKNFEVLKYKKLESINLSESENTIKNIFDNLRLKRISTTAISKIMHIINPDLFVMVDDEIRKGYGFSNNAIGYINFLKRMQIEAKEILKTFCEEYNVNEEEIKKEVCKKCHNNERSLPKLIDEYNYTLFTRKL